MSELELVRPPRLRRGDKIAVCAPSGPAPDERLKAGLAILEERYTVELFWEPEEAEGYLAGSDKKRAAGFNNALEDSDVRAIFVSRGGYGAMRIVPELNSNALRSDPKPIIGFSDATAILSWAVSECAVQAVHGPVVTQLSSLSGEEQEWLFRILEEPSPAGLLPWELEHVGADSREELSARLVGGNLCLVSHLSQTSFDTLAFEGDIALLAEDVAEQPYAIDRYLTGLHLSGSLCRVSAALLGSFTACVGKRYPAPTASAVLDESLKRFGIPGLAGLPIGHGKHNWAIPVGAQVVVDFARTTLALEGGAVS